MNVFSIFLSYSIDNGVFEVYNIINQKITAEKVLKKLCEERKKLCTIIIMFSSMKLTCSREY